MFVMTPNDSHRWHGLSLGLPYINRHSCRLICQPWIIISRRFFNIQTLKEKNSRSIQHRYTKDCWHRDKEHSRTGCQNLLCSLSLWPWPHGHFAEASDRAPDTSCCSSSGSFHSARSLNCWEFHGIWISSATNSMENHRFLWDQWIYNRY